MLAPSLHREYTKSLISIMYVPLQYTLATFSIRNVVTMLCHRFYTVKAPAQFSYTESTFCVLDFHHFEFYNNLQFHNEDFHLHRVVQLKLLNIQFYELYWSIF